MIDNMQQLVKIADIYNSSIPENALVWLGFRPDEELDELFGKYDIQITETTESLRDVFYGLDYIAEDMSVLDIINAAHHRSEAGILLLYPAVMDVVKVWAAEKYNRDYRTIMCAIEEGYIGMKMSIRKMTWVQLYNIEEAESYMQHMILSHMDIALSAV